MNQSVDYLLQATAWLLVWIVAGRLTRRGFDEITSNKRRR